MRLHLFYLHFLRACQWLLLGMAYQLPCLLSQACNLPQAFQSHAAIEADPDSARLIQSLQQLFLHSDNDRQRMGSQGYVSFQSILPGSMSRNSLSSCIHEFGLISSAPDFVRVSL